LLLVASLCLLALRRTRAPAIFLIGFALFVQAGTDIVSQRVDARYEGDSMLAVVRVADFPRRSGNSVVLVIESMGDPRIPPRSRVSWFEAPVVPLLGEVWELELRLRQPRGNLNPGLFDSESWLFRQKFHATGYVVGGSRNRLLWSGTASPEGKFRARFVSLARAAADSDEAAATLAAIGVGARHLVTREQWDRFALSGTSHLMAISGLHVGLAALVAFCVVFGLAAVIPVHGNHYVVAVCIGTLLAGFYAVVSGLGVPARRAILMLAAGVLILARRRQLSPTDIIAGAAIVVFVTDPVASLTPGFHLSFAAVLVLLWLAKRKVRGTRCRVLALPRELLVMQVGLLFGLFPITSLTFNRFAVMATPVNLLAVPLFSAFTVPMVLAGLSMTDIWESAALAFLRAAAFSIDFLDRVIGVFLTVPAADISLAAIDGIAWLFVVLPLLLVLLPRGWPGRYVAILGLFALVAWKPAVPPKECFDTSVLDVGQGLAVVVQTSDSVTIYDTGMAWRGGGSAAELIVLPFLEARRIQRVDRLLVSHSDLDHSGGLTSLREQLEIGHIMVGEAMPGIEARQCGAGQLWQSGGIRFELLHPQLDKVPAGNDASCVLRVSVGGYSLLLTGDIEAPAERSLIERDSLDRTDVVVVPHHGSKTSSTAPFVTALRPEIAIVSAGYANRWGFPKPDVVARWQASGALLLNTATSGAVTTRICSGKGVVDVSEERERRRRFWHAET
jgi:competence protein ComEC